MSDNPFAKENNPFSSGGDAPAGEDANANPFVPGAMPAADPETTKPRQMPGGGEGPPVTDANVPQESPPPMDKAMAYIRHTNPDLPAPVVRRLAQKVVVLAVGGPNPLQYGMTTFEERKWGKQPKDQMGDLNDPYNQWSPLNYDHPNYGDHQGKKPWEIGDLNDRRNPNSPLHPRHELNHHYMRSGLFNQQSTVRQSSLDSLVEFFAQD